MVLLIPLGLCGLNYGVFAVGSGSVPGSASRDRLTGLLVVTAFAETAAILASCAALLISLLGLLVTSIFKRTPQT